MKTELTWEGKHHIESVDYYPAQLKERYGNVVNGWMNKIFKGDNLKVIGHLMKDFQGKIDLIYIDPPFDSKADYKKTIKVDNNSFEEIQYKDKWTDDEYLQFMYERLVLMRELLSDKGSIYVHCDWHKSHHLRMIMDEVFGVNNFQREIIWQLIGISGYKSLVDGFVRGHDTILYYAKNNANKIFNKSYLPYSEEQLKRFSSIDEKGRRFKPITKERRLYLDESKGVPISDVWGDIASFQTVVNSPERTNYPTQKPEALIERIIKASSNPGDIVFDCFMGSGTTQAVAMKLGRHFIGADNNSESIQTVIKRLYSILKSSESVLFDENKRYSGFEVYSLDEDLQNDIESLVIKEGNKIVIKSFKSNSLESKLSIPVSDWKQIVDTVMIDWNFKEVFHPSIVDTEVLGEYKIPNNTENIMVKITDRVSKSIYVSVKNN